MGLRRMDVAGGTRGAPLAARARALTIAASIAAILSAMSPPHPSSEEIFHRLLDESSALLAAPERAGIVIPDDELHSEIIVPLLPAMLGDKAIRGHWSGQHATGFPMRLARHFENGDPPPRWTPDDFEIHVTASFSAGPDARALADTLLSEESLRDMAAALMNQLLDVLWPSLVPAPAEVPSEAGPAIKIPPAETPAAEIPALEIPEPIETPAAAEIPEPIEPVIEVSEPILLTERMPAPEPAPELVPASEPEPELTPAPAQPAATEPEILPSAIEPECAKEIQPAEFLEAREAPSRALIRTLCRKLAASALRRGAAANSAPFDASAAVVARRIISRPASAGTRRVVPTTRGFPSRSARPGCR